MEQPFGLQAAPVPFTSVAFRSGFHTGRLGIGHAVLVSHRLEETARLKDKIALIETDGAW